MALARGDDGALYLGTSDRALLVRLRGAGRAEVLYDFEGSEVTALALRGKRLAVVSNQFPKSLKPEQAEHAAAAASECANTRHCLAAAPGCTRRRAKASCSTSRPRARPSSCTARTKATCRRWHGRTTT